MLNLFNCYPIFSWNPLKCLQDDVYVNSNTFRIQTPMGKSPLPNLLHSSMIKTALFVLIATLAPAAIASLEERIVKIHAVQQSYSISKPWTRNSPKDISGSGFIFKSGHVLTNAHVVRYARQVYIQPYQSSLKIEAEVLFSSPQMDLAILRPLDDSFVDFDAIELDATIPTVASTVSIYGYPVGGDELSVTEGVISRVEVATYNQTTSGLRLQVDAAINSGNSGGPAFVDEKLVGIVFSRIQEADNIGYVIPVEEVNLFLSDIEDEQYDGKWRFPYHLTRLQNRNMREAYQLTDEMGGMLVTDSLDSRLGTDGLQPGDVLLQIGSHDIDRTGNVRIRKDLRLGLRYFIPQLVEEGRIPVTVLRDGQAIDIQTKLTRELNRLIPYRGEGQPEYFIYGPLPFAVIYQEFVTGLSKNSLQALSKLGYEPLFRRLEQQTEPGQQLITCPTKMFAHAMTKGMSDPAFCILKRVNGEDILNLDELVDVLSKLTTRDTAIFEFETPDHTRTRTIILKHKEVLDAMEDILSDNGIRNPYSSKYRRAWEAY